MSHSNMMMARNRTSYMRFPFYSFIEGRIGHIAMSSWYSILAHGLPAWRLGRVQHQYIDPLLAQRPIGTGEGASCM